MLDTQETKTETLIGVISDTHGLLRPQIEHIFRDVDHIIHAGDIVDPQVLDELEAIAPVTAVRGNMDYGEWADHLPFTTKVKFGKVSIFLTHDAAGIVPEGFDDPHLIVVCGHTHQPKKEKQKGVLFLNPGSAGPKRYDYPTTVALLRIRDDDIQADIIDIE